MWLLGLILLVLGLLVGSGLLFWLGVIFLVVGVVVYFVPARHDSRRWYW
jgi:membrane protein implicated in regulation of membrane protease activity